MNFQLAKFRSSSFDSPLRRCHALGYSFCGGFLGFLDSSSWVYSSSSSEEYSPDKSVKGSFFVVEDVIVCPFLVRVVVVVVVVVVVEIGGGGEGCRSDDNPPDGLEV